MKSLKSYTFFGILFVLTLGTLSHFFYNWSNNNFFVSLFSPVNESTWEHMKLAFFPMLLFSLFTNARLKDLYPCIPSSLYFSILLSTFLIPVLFYTYTGILGFHIAVLDIGTFVVSVILSFFVQYKLTVSCKMQKLQSLLGFLVIVCALLFFIFTYVTPEIALFAEP